MAGRTATVKATAKAATSKKSATNSATASATTDATSKKTAAKSRRKPKPETRTRIYWAVFNENLKRVAVFEYDQKSEAEKRVNKLIKASGDHHFIQKIKATVTV